MRNAVVVVLVVASLGLVLSAREAAPVAEKDARAAAARALALVQTSVASFDRQRQCASCHHHGLTLAALRVARERGVAFDEAAARASIDRGFRGLANLDNAVQAAEQIDPSLDWGTWLGSADDAGIEGNLTSAVFARLLALRQEADGRWMTLDVRPPQSVSVFTATALSVRAVNRYLPDSLAADRQARVARARRWLLGATPVDTEDRTFQLLGLKWAGASADEMRPHAGRLAGEQRSDGGWAQTPTLASDAYATGQALVALASTGSGAGDAAVQRGLQYLLSSQKADGSWHVATRIHEQDLLSPQFFDAGFPHGMDQFASVNGTLWAAMGLMSSLPVAAPGARVFASQAIAVEGEQPWMRAALFGSVADLRALLDGGVPATASSARGTTMLMMAVPDTDKVRLVLERGADIKAESRARHTALMVAANYRGTTGLVRTLLEGGASALPPANQAPGRAVSPLLYAVWSGDLDKVTAMLDRGASVDAKVTIGGGIFTARPVQIAVFQRDVPMIKLLVARGASLTELSEGGVSLLTDAVFMNDAALVSVVLALGADVNQVDQNGETSLMHAASIDHGDTRVLEALLAAGARRDLAAPDKRTALAMAREYGHAAHVRKLE
jgi:ankyrin repeat protein